MGCAGVVEVHLEPIVHHRAGEAPEHASGVGGSFAARLARVQERVEICRADVEPHGVGADLVRCLVDMDDRRRDESFGDLGQERVESSRGLFGQGSDEAGRDRRPEHLRKRLGGAFDRAVLCVQQVEGRSTHVGAVGDGARASRGNAPALTVPHLQRFLTERCSVQMTIGSGVS